MKPVGRRVGERDRAERALATARAAGARAALLEAMEYVDTADLIPRNATAREKVEISGVLGRISDWLRAGAEAGSEPR